MIVQGSIGGTRMCSKAGLDFQDTFGPVAKALHDLNNYCLGSSTNRH